MRICLSDRCLPKRRTRILDWRRDEGGAAALEFAIVAFPFFLFVLALLGLGLYFFTSTSLEYGVEVASRKIRTGEAEKGDMTVGQFRQLVCSSAGPTIDCSKLNVIVQHGASWSGISPQACANAKGQMTASNGSTGEDLTKYSGTANSVVLVTLCYQWDLASDFPFLNIGRNGDGSGPAIIQAATAFKNEPYSNGAS